MTDVETVALILGPCLFLIGAWTVVHPNGGYRAAGGVGSGLTAHTRAAYGAVFMLVGLFVMFGPVPT